MVDKISSSATGNGGGIAIAFDFKQHYFTLQDFASVPTNITAGITLKIGAPAATSDVVFGHSFYYNTLVTISTLVVVKDANLVVLYSTSITPNTYNVLKVKSVLTFTHTNVITADMSFAIFVNISNGANYTMGAGCTNAAPVYSTPIYCAVSENLYYNP
jgi:hypothetical protein